MAEHDELVDVFAKGHANASRISAAAQRESFPSSSHFATKHGDRTSNVIKYEMKEQYGVITIDWNVLTKFQVYLNA